MAKKGTSSEKSRDSELSDKLLENMVKLQKVHTDLAERFDKLAKEISSLLALFETAAKNMSKSTTTKISEDDKTFLDKIDKLIEQNKTIAKGLMLMEGKIRKDIYNPEPSGNPSEEIRSEEALPMPLQPPTYNPPVRSNRPLPKF